MRLTHFHVAKKTLNIPKQRGDRGPDGLGHVELKEGRFSGSVSGREPSGVTIITRAMA